MRLSLTIAAVCMTLWCAIASAQGPEGDGELRNEQRWLRTRPVISDIAISGNTAVSEGKIRDWMELNTAGFWGKIGLGKRPLLNLATLHRDENTIAWHYSRLGYWDASAKINAVSGKDDDHADVAVVIDEGVRYFWGGVTIDADSLSFADRLNRIIGNLPRAKPADSIEFVLTQGRLLAECANRGYPAARLSADVSTRTDTIDVSFKLWKGPHVVFGDVQVEGLKHTKARIVHRVLRIEKGTEYSHKQIEERRQDVYATGLFTLVRLDPSYSDTTDTNRTVDSREADLLVRLVERPSSFVGFRTGAGQDEFRDLTWEYAVDWGSRNWLGTARRYT